MRVVLATLLGGAAFVAMLPLVPSVQRDLGPATVSARAEIGSGETTFVTPPLGSLAADTHDSLLDVEVNLEEIDIPEIEEALSADPSLTNLVDSVEGDLRALSLRLFLQLIIAGAAAGAFAAAVLPWRRSSDVVSAAVGGTLVAFVAMFLTTATFEQKAFEQPRFTGALRRAPQVIEAANRGIGSFEDLSSSYEDLSQRFVQLLALSVDPQLDIRPDAIILLHVSDIHSNPLGVEFTRRLARAFDVDAVVDTGDLTSYGHPFETNLIGRVEGIDAPYLFVPGNHDSPANRAAADRLTNVELLNAEIGEVGDVSILGWADPTFTASNQITTEQGNELRLLDADDVLAAIDELGPDILAVHDIRLASESFGSVGIILAGHTHERRVEERDGTIALTVGSSGATGIGSLLVESALPYEAQVLYLTPGTLIVDYVSLSGIGNRFDVQRRVFDLAPAV